MNEDKLPFDQHELLALIAPRPLYVASASLDRWADPKGEMLSLTHAVPVYKLYGYEGITSYELPEVNSPVRSDIMGYHLREGKHRIELYDWQQYVIFADRFPLLYFVKDYNFDYYAAFKGCSSENEVSASTLKFLIDKTKENNIKVIFKIELSSEQIANTESKQDLMKYMLR